jgi:hypothetical protein
MPGKRCRLTVVPLENRDVPASFGVPWPDPTHLTLSFAPDGTSAAGVTSRLVAALDAQMPRAEWQGAILRAAQTWAEVANLNIGVVNDNGAAFGTAGATQGDPRFGDIRIAGVPMAGDALGEAVPPDPVLAGTLAGDVFFNTSATFTAEELYSVALHEFGHALGLAPSADTRSVMFNQLTNRTDLASSDVVTLRSLYGKRPGDPAEGSNGNGSLGRATRMRLPSSFDGETPLVAYGTLASRKDVDSFSFRNESDYSGPITIQVQTEGISMVAPRLSVFDHRRKLIGQATASGMVGDTLTFHLPESLPGRAYYLRIEAALGSEARMGRYGVAVTFDDRLEPLGITIDEVLRGPYDALDENDIAELFEDPNDALYDDDYGDDDSDDDANDLRAVRGPLGLARFAVTASLTDAADVDFYRIRAPKFSSRTTMSLIASVRSIGANGVTPQVEVFDRDMNPMPYEVLVNGAGAYTVQVPGVESHRRYFLRVSGAGDGNFTLEATFRKQAVALDDFASGTATDTQPARYKLYAARTQLFGFTLSATGPAGAAVRMTITNESGATVFDLTANAGETVSSLSTFLPPGEYTILLTSVGTVHPVGFAIRGAVQTDPIGPQPSDSSLAPKYPDPTNPDQYLYPNGQVSLDPYLWIVWMFV